MTPSKQDVTKYLVYGAIALLFINSILLLLPFVEVYQPSYSKTVLGVTTYEGWYTSSAPMVKFIFPVFLTGIPYLCAISLLSPAQKNKKKNKKSDFIKIIDNEIDKPIRFFWLKFATIANVISIWIIYSTLQCDVGYLEKHGAYCKLTTFGILNCACSVAFVLVLFVLSYLTKSMVKKAVSVPTVAFDDPSPDQLSDQFRENFEPNQETTGEEKWD